jgi:glucosamine--fructose-6-phosphate aminotransferase (isomerizing)
MCGIIGYTGTERAVTRLLEGLETLEYRGYDSAGIAMHADDRLVVTRAVGPVSQLATQLDRDAEATCGVGHTRWATHGRVSVENAHPIAGCRRELVVVLNGIIENFHALREQLLACGHVFTSDTDAEVVAHLIEERYTGDLAEAVGEMLGELTGHFALVATHLDHPGLLVAVRRSCPLVVGLGRDGVYVSSMTAAFAGRVEDTLMLEDDEVVVLRPGVVTITDQDGAAIERMPAAVIESELSMLGGYDSFMAKEIAEQPEAIRATLAGRVDRFGRPTLTELPADLLESATRIEIVACGTAYHAGLYGSHLIESWSGIDCRAHIASEWRYAGRRIDQGTLVICVSQSGETADTLAAAAHARDQGATTLAVVNMADSQLVRQCDAALLTRAGLEVGVAATKTFSAQVAVLSSLALELAHRQGRLERRQLIDRGRALRSLPDRIGEFLESDHPTFDVADRVYDQPFFLFLGRQLGLPIALEGALKLKELSYIPTDAYAAGEMKHGPIALLSEQTPVVCVATDGPTYDKLVSNILEVRARGASVIAIASHGNEDIQHHADEVIYVPGGLGELSPLVAAVALQLLALRIATCRGLNVDRPRNLAKTVTVE